MTEPLHTKWTDKVSTHLFVWTLAGIILPITLIMLFTTQRYERYIRCELSGRTITQLNRSEEEIYNIFRRMVNISSVICNNPDFQQALQSPTMDRYERTVCFDELVKTIEVNNLYTMDDIKITCFDADGNVYANWSTNYHNYDFLLQQDWVRQSIAEDGFVQWNMFAPAYVLEENDKTNYISVARSMLSSSGGKRLATIVVSIEQTTLSQALGEFLYDPSDAVYIWTEDGKIVLSLDNEQAFSESDVRELTENLQADSGSQIWRNSLNSYLLSYYTLSRQFTFNGQVLKVLYLIRYDHITHEMDKMQHGILVILFAAVILIIGLAFVLSRALTKPIEILSNTMLHYRPEDSIEGLDLKRKDEIGQLNHSFVKMGDTISDLFARQRRETEEKERYRYEALRAQVNPHFLFNTLNTIRWMAIIRNADNIVNCIDALATMLKYSMTRGGEMVTIREEIESINSYIYIYNCRYGERFIFEPDLSEEIQNLHVIKFILQPIVENSVLHGFKGQEQQGRILLYGDIEDDALKLFVEDNGTGLSPEAEEQLNKPRGKVTGIGINNVNDRIRSSYGEKFGIRVYNGTVGGAIAEYTLPVIREEDKDADHSGC